MYSFRRTNIDQCLDRYLMVLSLKGLVFFLARGVVDSSFFSFPLVSRERLMVEPMVRVQVKRMPLLVSSWQTSRNFMPRAASLSLGVMLAGKGDISEVLE